MSLSSSIVEHEIWFGEQRPGALSVPLRPLGGAPPVERWESSDELLFGSVVADASRPLEEVSRELYARVIREVREAGFPYFVRMWNYVGSINAFDRDRERYQLFCAGRHDAFVAAGYHHDVDLPAASAVGMPGRGA
ncbi:MAG TPA: hypothetical protein VF846_21970, partial [Thermoanaerobaculia bacterium]